MAYRIHYQSGNAKISRRITVVSPRVGAAALLLAAVILTRLCSRAGTAALSRYLDHSARNRMELAVSAMSDAVTAGEGWYHALAVWCASMLFGI